MHALASTIKRMVRGHMADVMSHVVHLPRLAAFVGKPVHAYCLEAVAVAESLCVNNHAYRAIYFRSYHTPDIVLKK